MAELGGAAAPATVAVACGVFDGVHRGHQQILASLLELAAKTGALPVALTFEPHPRMLVRPHAPPLRLTSLSQKVRILGRLGVQAVVVLPFTEAVAGMPPAEFVAACLRPAGVTLTGICVGESWRFGAEGAGDTALLRRLGGEGGFYVVPVPEFLYYRRPVSSTRIRRALGHGRLEFAERLLGRPYAIEGTVAHGKGLGDAVLSCPTANIAVGGQLLPPYGVYAAAGTVDPDLPGAAQRRYAGIAYVGPAATFAVPGGARGTPVLEFHLFDFSGDLYDRRVEVEFLEFVRPDRVFPTVADLKEQIRQDVAVARHAFTETA